MPTKGFKHTEETKAKMRLSHLGVARPDLVGTHHSESQKRKIGDAMRLWYSTHKDPRLGRKHSAETKLKISISSRGDKNGNWKGGLTALVRGIRRSPELYQWRKSVLERDLFTCQDCGGKGNIAAHHIKPIIEYPSLIFVVENGLTLCDECHKRHTAWMWLKLKAGG